VTPKRKDRVAPPPGPDEWDLRYATNDAAKGWEELGRQVPHNLSRAWEALRTNPRPQPATTRQHQLKGKLGTGTFDGREMPCWQYEVTGGGRIWYLVDDERHTVWIQTASTGHPKATE
jgi:hypothetical protein